MKLKYIAPAVLLAAIPASQAFAAGEVQMHPIAPVFENKEYAEKIGAVKFYFGDQKHPDGKALGEIKTSGKTNSFNKDGQTWFGAQYKSSSTEYICGSGAFIARTEVKGTVMRIP
jgi:hypothetical protein